MYIELAVYEYLTARKNHSMLYEVYIQPRVCVHA